MNKLHFNYKQEKHFCQERRKINMEKKYYLGLDIGTNSVGWAVTDENYNLCKFNGKKMWGIRLFEDAKTAAERRTKRSITGIMRKRDFRKRSYFFHKIE